MIKKTLRVKEILFFVNHVKRYHTENFLLELDGFFIGILIDFRNRGNQMDREQKKYFYLCRVGEGFCYRSLLLEAKLLNELVYPSVTHLFVLLISFKRTIIELTLSNTKIL